MKYFVIICLALVSAITASAQKDFEGVIKYKIISSDASEEKGMVDSIHLTAFFSPGKMLMKTNKDEEEDILVLLDSGKVYKLNKDDKTYRVKKLRETTAPVSSSSEMIAGYMATPAQLNGNMFGGIFGGNTTFWYADNLSFTVPQKYERNEELLLISKNHILLKAIIRMEYSFDNNMDEENENIKDKSSEMKLIATEIIAAPQSPSLFTIPAEYIKVDSRSFVPPSFYDTAMVMVDSVTAVMDPVPPHPPQKPTPPKKAPVKQPVKTAPAKKPIRKEN